ncbi:MAG: TonB-dependent receptor [Pseudomonadota bacterium]
MKQSIIASLVGLAITSPLFSAENISLEDVTVKANRFERKESETTYASEIHTAKQIEASSAATLYDFLAQQTSLNVLSGFGNKAAPLINLRGFGSENGYQNVAITLDGQRLNNIDLTPQLLGAIPLSNIERIEISKGSGSVIYGDGATAGAIQIYTKAKTGFTIGGSLGNYGQKSGYISAGISEQYVDLSASAADDSHDGFSKKDIFGERDTFDSATQNVKLKIKPNDTMRLKAEATSARINTFYVGTLTEAEFKDNPRQNSGNAYTYQQYKTDQWRLGFEYDISQNISFEYNHGQEDKTSFFDTFNFFSQLRDYDYSSDDLTLKYESGNLRALTGLQKFDGKMQRTSDTTSKENLGIFAQVEYQWDALIMSAGARHERVEYDFAPVGSAKLNKDNHLEAFDIGANYKLSAATSIFTNFNQAFQAPDIDRFFGFGFGFNPEIVPAKSKTLNIGLNHVLPNNRLKINTFYSELKNEIFYNPTFGFFGTNTNIDQSHKYGLELQDHFKLNNQLTAGLIYTYTRAIIDSENDGTLAINNKDLPGVPKHTVVANLNYAFIEHASVNLNHTWRSKAYAFNDFQNNFDQRQDSYNSTNIALNYQYKNLNFFTAINNIFEQENSIQIQDDGLYPIDFARTWRVGMRADF